MDLHQGPEKHCLIFSEEQVEDDFLPEVGDVGNLTYSPVLVCIIVFYVIYYACTVLRIFLVIIICIFITSKLYEILGDSGGSGN